MKILIKLIYIICLAVFTTLPEVFALSANDYKNDIAYYEKTVKTKNLTPNDKIYILLKIKEKYSNAGVDISWLNSEIDRLTRLKSANLSDEAPKKEIPKNIEEPAAEKKSIAGKFGKIEDIIVTEQTDKVLAIIKVANAGKINSFVLTDPKKRYNPKIVIDVENVEDNIEFQKKDFNPPVKEIMRIRIGQKQEKPLLITRIIIELDEERKYKFDSTKDEITVAIKKDRKVEISEQPEETEQVKLKPAIETPEVTAKPEMKAHIVAAPEDIDKKYTISPGDIVKIDVKPQNEFSKETEVDNYGFISLNLVGMVKLKDLNTVQAESAVKNKINKYTIDPNVSIVVVKFGNEKVFTIGETNVPAELPFKNNITLYDWLKLNGGFKPYADLSRVMIYRGKPGMREQIPVNLETLIREGKESETPIIQSGDIIQVPKMKSTVFILGEVEKPGRYELLEDRTTLLKLLARADGHTKNAYIKKIIIARERDHGNMNSFKFNLETILRGNLNKDIILYPGDIIYIPKKR
ncbi:MAG: polysaccharide biosynthesis/export family protein [bacterium]